MELVFALITYLGMQKVDTSYFITGTNQTSILTITAPNTNGLISIITN